MFIFYLISVLLFTTVNVPVETQKVLVEGNVTIAVVLAVKERFENGTCSGKVDIASVMRLEAILWYIRYINTYASLPFTIGNYVVVVDLVSNSATTSSSFNTMTELL